MEDLIRLLPEIAQATYFALNPYNPNNTEDNYQELFQINLERSLNVRVGSEITVQKWTKDINGDKVALKHKSERYDLVIDTLGVLFELKNVGDMEPGSLVHTTHLHQLFNYMDNSSYKYGILLNFQKMNKKGIYKCSGEIYRKSTKVIVGDKYDMSYCRYHYEKFHEFESEDYGQLIKR